MARGRRRKTVGPEGPERPRTVTAQAIPASVHGERKQLAELQRAAPMGGTQPLPVGVPQRPPVPDLEAGVFAPTERPGEPPTAGLEAIPRTPDPVELLRVAYAQYPHPLIAALIEDLVTR